MAPKEIRGVIKKFRSSLKKAGFPPCKVLVFGSYARGEARADSDIDLCLVSKSFERGREKFRKEATFVAFDVDPRIQVVVTDPARLKSDVLSPLLHRIRKEGRAI